jgi:anti-anti-sigma factor
MDITVQLTVIRRATVTVTGRLDALTTPEMRTELTRLEQADVHDITIDLSGVEFVDSAGLAALVKAMKTAREHGGDVELIRPRSDDAYRVFQLTKFDAVFTIHPAQE